MNNNLPGSPMFQGAAGSGNTPPTSPPQGQSGGLATPGVGGQSIGGAGGGGASQAGQNTPSVPTAGNGGDGTGTAINPAVGVPGPSPSLKYFAGGGGGGCEVSPASSCRSRWTRRRRSWFTIYTFT
jgi:hypothetical protein